MEEQMKITVEYDNKYIVDVLGDKWLDDDLIPKKVTISVEGYDWIILPKDKEHLNILVKSTELPTPPETFKV